MFWEAALLLAFSALDWFQPAIGLVPNKLSRMLGKALPVP